MKSPIRLLLAAAVCATAVSTQAQSPTSPSPASPEQAAKPYGERGGRGYDRMADKLPEETRERFKALRDEVLQDPKIAELRAKLRAAGKEFHDAMQEAMSARDPELTEKVRAHYRTKWEKEGQRGPEAKKSKNPPADKPRVAPEERDRIEKAREIARQAPAVQSARAKMQAAETPEAKREAGIEYHEAMRAAMLTADPSLVDVLEKLPPKRGDSPDAKPDPDADRP